MKVKTVAYKGSKRRLLANVEHYCKEIAATSVFDGFSGTGIVSAHLRSRGYIVTANDINYSSYIYGCVFLHGYDEQVVKTLLEQMNGLLPLHGWITENYSGDRERVIRGTGGRKEIRPLGYTKNNAMRIDAAREWVESLDSVSTNDKNALVFSIVHAADKVFNNSTDQKSSLKAWTSASQKPINFTLPTLIEGPTGTQLQGDVLSLDVEADLVYFDPPYTHGVLYASCYHLNDSIAKWDKATLDHTYAIPRPQAVCFRKNGEKAGGFYNKRTAADAFNNILGTSKCKRIVLSYSDAPRNVLTIEELIAICCKYGDVKVESHDHKICTQPSDLKKISTALKEYFIVIDK